MYQMRNVDRFFSVFKQERHGDHPDLFRVAHQEGARVEDGEEEGRRAHLPASAPLHCQG